MKRIDSANARSNANGLGKAGFHDNADLSGQDATYLTPDWLNHVQEEIANVIEGFGVALNSAQKNQVFIIVKNISNRTALLEEFVENIVDFIYPVGVVIDFGISTINPNVRFAGTTWVRHAEGKASVGLSTQENDPDWTKNIGSTFGEYEHKLEENEIPKIEGQFVTLQPQAYEDSGVFEKIESSDATVGGGRTPWQHDTIGFSFGSGQKHNNVQPSVVDARWIRIA